MMEQKIHLRKNRSVDFEITLQDIIKQQQEIKLRDINKYINLKKKIEVINNYNFNLTYFK